MVSTYQDPYVHDASNTAPQKIQLLVLHLITDPHFGGDFHFEVLEPRLQKFDVVLKSSGAYLL